MCRPVISGRDEAVAPGNRGRLGARGRRELAEDVIGFASALLTQGTAGVVASIADVDDVATVQVMLALHAGLASGQRLDEALAGARRSSYGDPVRHATAVLFAAMGAA